MKILKKTKNKYIRFLLITICCYLVASIGVNKVANPLYYFTANEEHLLDYYTENTCLYIDLRSLDETDCFINIYVSKIHRFGTVVYLYSETTQSEKTYTLLSKGSNSIKISDLPSTEGTIYIRLNDLDKDKTTISQITGSVRRNIDILSMLKIFASSILLVMFWEFLRSIKKKYTM